MRFGAASADQLVLRLLRLLTGLCCRHVICVRRLMLTYKMLSVFILLQKHAETNSMSRSSVVMESVVSLSPLVYNYVLRGVWVASSCMSKAMQHVHLLNTVA